MPLLTPLVSYKRPNISYSWSGSVRGPFIGTSWGNGTNFTVSGGVAGENNPGPTNGAYFSGACYQDPVGTALHYAQITHNSTAGGAAQPRGVGALVGGNSSTPTSGVFCIGSAFATSDATTIYSLSGTTATARATGTQQWTTADLMRLVITHNGTNYIYTVFRNGVDTGIFWSDTGGLISPGVWAAPAFGCGVSGAYFGSHGAVGFSCGDTTVGAVNYTYTFVASTHGPFTDWGQGYSVDSSARANNNNAPAVNGDYYSGGVYTSPMGSISHAASVTMSNISNGYNCGSGVAVAGSDASFTNGVFAIGTTAVGGTYSTEIFTKIGSTYTSRTGGGTGAWTTSDVMTVQVTYNGTNYIYTVLRNNIGTGVSWTDTGNVITPGYYTGFAFHHAYSSGQAPAEGIQGTWTAGDL